ncbi:hypothetical protein BGW39_000855 [Mortierella sp. 14UC]|nr:hypothetical protein BGW39_000855 [Mortierella sp. 14UC]
MNNPKEAVRIPVTYDGQESRPLLNNKQQPKLGCARGFICKRCLAGTHENTRARSFLRRLVIILSLLWFFWTIHHWVNDLAVGANEDCLHHLIPWNGPTTITSDTADSIDVSFGKGDIYSTVEILTQDHVVQPTVIIDAWVTRNYNEGDVKEGDGHHRRVRGLEIEVTEVDGRVKVVLTSEDNNGRQGHHWTHKKKFCAKVDIKIVFPPRLRTYNRLAVGGVLLDLDVRRISQIAFESIYLNSTVGNIVLHDIGTKEGSNDGVQAKDLHIVSVTGSIHIAATRPVLGYPLQLKLESTVGSIKFNATTNPIKSVEGKPSQELRHNVLLKTTTGHIQAFVRPGVGHADPAVMMKNGTIPGDVFVSGDSTVGHVETDLVMAPGQVLHQELSNMVGSVESIVSDNYLGAIDVRTDYGSASLTETHDSASSIEYEQYTKTIKVGHKVLKKGGQGSGEERGVMVLSSTYGSSRLTFVPL